MRSELERRQQELAGSRQVLAKRWEQLKVAQEETDALRQQVVRLTAEQEQRRRPPALPLPGASAIEFACSQCGMKIKVKSEFAGRSSRCPTCKQPLVVPTAPAATAR
jgi:hypothetical protein